MDSTKINADAANFFILLETLYVFLTTSKYHIIYLEQQKDLHPTQQTHESINNQLNAKLKEDMEHTQIQYNIKKCKFPCMSVTVASLPL